MTDSIYCLIPEFQKFTCNCLSLLPFSSLLFQLFVLFPVHAIFLNWLCNHWISNLRLSYPPVACKGFAQRKDKTKWKKTVRAFISYCILLWRVKNKHCHSDSFRKTEQGSLEGATGLSQWVPIQWLHVSHFWKEDPIGAARGGIRIRPFKTHKENKAELYRRNMMLAASAATLMDVE